MKTFTKFAMVTTMVLFGASLKSKAQVTASTPNANFVCNGGSLTLPAPDPNTIWIVRYSATATSTPGTQLTLTGGNVIAAADLQTGFYYLISKGTAANSCESEMQELPVYEFAPLTSGFTFADYCSENAAATTFTGSATSTDAVTTFSYQWYTVDASNVETAISGANTANYVPTIVNNTNTDITTKYRLKAGYLVAGKRYCTVTTDHDVKTLAKPTTPTITIPSTGETI